MSAVFTGRDIQWQLVPPSQECGVRREATGAGGVDYWV